MLAAWPAPHIPRRGGTTTPDVALFGVRNGHITTNLTVGGEGIEKGRGSVGILGLGSEGGTRTHNLPVNSRLLCRLSYLGRVGPHSNWSMVARGADLTGPRAGIRYLHKHRQWRMRCEAASEY